MKFKPEGPFTTGQVAKILGCAQRTVARMTDSGALKGYHINADRRVTYEELVKFCGVSNIPLDQLINRANT